MEASDRSTCPSCGSTRLHWHVERAGRRGHPLSVRSIVWRCVACDIPVAAAEGDAPRGAPPDDGAA